MVGFLVNQGAALPVATDIAQETMIKAYQRWGEINQPKAWVHTVASRALVRMVASAHEEPLEHVPEATALLPCDNAAAEWEAQHDTLGILRSLPHRQRQVLAWTLSGYTPPRSPNSSASLRTRSARA
ncbi:RNA polymerase sigma factor [Streptosporangium lutulentum]